MTFSEFLESDLSQQPHYLLIGNPVSHSVSPLMHNTALEYYGIEAKYQAVSVSLKAVSSAVAHFNSKNFLGANITIPHKETFLDAVDELTETAREIGAINTLIKKDGKLIGDNTDAYGFMQPIEESGLDLDPDRAIIFGVGGATKAIVYALQEYGFQEICMVSRNPDRLEPQDGVIACSYDSWQEYADEATLMVNATPLGMTPNIEASPVKDEETELLIGKLCYDIVYNPRETKFLRQGNTVQAELLGGLEMLIHQGAKSFKLWTGKEFPVALVKMKLDELY